MKNYFKSVSSCFFFFSVPLHLDLKIYFKQPYSYSYIKSTSFAVCSVSHCPEQCDKVTWQGSEWEVTRDWRGWSAPQHSTASHNTPNNSTAAAVPWHHTVTASGHSLPGCGHRNSCLSPDPSSPPLSVLPLTLHITQWSGMSKQYTLQYHHDIEETNSQLLTYCWLIWNLTWLG